SCGATQHDGGAFFRNAPPEHWVLQFDSRSPTPSPPPAWLVARDSELFKIHMAFGGRAYAFIGQQVPASSCQNNIEIVAPSGKSCGRMEFPIPGSCKSSHLDVGYDGTVIEGFPPEATPVAPDGAKHCTWSWWPAVL